MNRNCLSFHAALVCIVLVSGAFGCAQTAELPDDEVQVSEQPIIGGKASGTSQNAVVMLEIAKQAICTGTLVAPNLVLTARHCVSKTDEGLLCAPDGHAIDGGKIGADYDPQDIVVYSGQHQSTLRARALGAEIVHDGASNLCNHDLAFLVLDRDVTGTPIAALRTHDTTRVGELVTSVGWGLTAKGKLPSARMQRQNVPVLDVGPSSRSAPTDMLVGESICSGDSGGPALSAHGAIIGVVSHGGNGRYNASRPAAGCIGKNASNVYTRVAPFTKLLKLAFKQAGAKPRIGT